MNVLSLFAGIGGLDLGLERAGMTVVGVGRRHGVAPPASERRARADRTGLFRPVPDQRTTMETIADRLGLTTWDVEQLAWEERDWWAQEAEFKRRQDV